MIKDNKICVMCGEAYRYCANCPAKYNPTETWRNIFCSEKCRDTYQVYDKIKAGQITDKNAYKELKKLNSSYIQKLNEPMKSALSIIINSYNSNITKTDNKNENINAKEDDSIKDIEKSNSKIKSKHRVRKKIDEVG